MVYPAPRIGRREVSSRAETETAGPAAIAAEPDHNGYALNRPDDDRSLAPLALVSPGGAALL
jgi:hypothetical protein